MKFKAVSFLVFVLLFVSVVDVQGQFFSRRKHYSAVGGGLCGMNYFGDIVPNNGLGSADLSFTRPQLSFTWIRKFHPRFAFKSTLSWGRLQGDDFTSADPNDASSGIYRYSRNLHFRNDIIEVAAMMTVDLFENRGTYLKRPTLNPYLFLGFGMIYHNPRARTPIEDGNGWVALKPLQTEEKSYSNFQPVIPVGLGVRYKVNRNIDVAFEMGYRYTFTDYLDDVSGNYKAISSFTDELAAKMSNRSGEAISAYSGEQRDFSVIQSQYGGTIEREYDGGTITTARGIKAGEVRGNPGDNDLYLVYGFHVTYIIYKGMRSPKFR